MFYSFRAEETFPHNLLQLFRFSINYIDIPAASTTNIKLSSHK